jgi:hypothetical protein
LLKSKLEDAEDVDSVDISSEAVCIEYNALILAQEGVTELIREYGFPLSTYRKKQGVLTRFIENLARSNNNSYGSKKLDCCDLKH